MTDLAEKTTNVPEKTTNVPGKMTHDQYKAAISKLTDISKITTEGMNKAISSLLDNSCGLNMNNGTVIAKIKLITESGYGRFEKIINYFENCHSQGVLNDLAINNNINTKNNTDINNNTDTKNNTIYKAFENTQFGAIFFQCVDNPKCGLLEEKFFNCLKEEAQKDSISATTKSYQFLQTICNEQTQAGKAYLSARCNSDINHSSHYEFCYKIDTICELNMELAYHSEGQN